MPQNKQNPSLSLCPRLYFGRNGTGFARHRNWATRESFAGEVAFDSAQPDKVRLVSNPPAPAVVPHLRESLGAYPMSVLLRSLHFFVGNRRVNSRLTSTLAVMVVMLSVLLAHGQNKIHTTTGGGTINPGTLNADIPGPTAVVEDKSGNIYVAPPSAQYVFQWSRSTGAVTVFAGTGYITFHKIPEKATAAPLWSPSGLATDSQGNIYIADTGNNAIRKVDTSGNLTTVAGISKPCGGGNCGDNGQAVTAKLNAPQGVAIDSKGNIFVADTGDNRVRCVVMVARGCGAGVNTKIGTIINYAGNPNSACASSTDPCGDGGKAHLASLNTPMGIALDKAGHLFIADTQDHRIREVGNQFVINTIAGTGVLCPNSLKACGDGGAATSAELAAPRAVSVDGTGNVYIADTRDHRVRLVTGTTINAFAGTGQFGFAGDGGSPLSAELSTPNGVYVDATGNVFISDTGNQRIREVTGGTSGSIHTFMGGGSGGDGQSATGTYALLANPYQIALDASNNYYITDTSNNRIRVVNNQSSAIFVAGVEIQPGDIATVAGNGNVGYTGDNGAALSATLNSPFGLAVNGSGDIFIADSYNRVIREVNFAGTITTVAGSEGVSLPTALALDQAGDLFIADPAAQVVWELSGTTLTAVAGNGKAGYSGDGGPATSAQLDTPFGVALDSNDNLYIADANNNVIRCVLGVAGGCGDTTKKYSVGTIITYAFNGGYNFGGDGGPARKATRWYPNEVAVDSRGNLFVGGGNNPLVQRVDLASRTVLTVAGNDTEWYYYGFDGDGGAANKAHLNNVGLAVDSNENLLIADAGNNRIRQVPMIGVATLNPTSLNFGNQPVGTKSGPLPVTLQNTGADDIVISNITIGGDFSQTNNCPSTLPPSNAAFPVTCTFTVYFTPTKKGTRNGAIHITDNAYRSPQIIKLTGVGD
jgi:sugar lactone lactonase YvrE